MGAVAQNRFIPQKFHKNRNCRVSKSKIIIGLWFLALKARKAGNRPRTFYTDLTVNKLFLDLLLHQGMSFCGSFHGYSGRPVICYTLSLLLGSDAA